MPVVTKRATAKRDLIEHFIYLAENASVDVADRFLANAEASFNVLSQQPSMGAPLTVHGSYYTFDSFIEPMLAKWFGDSLTYAKQGKLIVQFGYIDEHM